MFGTVASNRVSPGTGDGATEDKEQFVWVYVLLLLFILTIGIEYSNIVFF